MKLLNSKPNWFATLNEALMSEGLLLTWNATWPPLKYGDNVSYTVDDGTKYGHYVSLYRDERGLYERPIHYARG